MDPGPSYRGLVPSPWSLIGPLFYEAQPGRYLGDDLARRSAHRGWVSQKTILTMVNPSSSEDVIVIESLLSPENTPVVPALGGWEVAIVAVACFGAGVLCAFIGAFSSPKRVHTISIIETSR